MGIDDFNQMLANLLSKIARLSSKAKNFTFTSEYDSEQFFALHVKDVNLSKQDASLLSHLRWFSYIFIFFFILRRMSIVKKSNTISNFVRQKT